MTGVESNIAEAGFDSVLLRTGQNGVMFGVANTVDDACVHQRNVVTLLAPTIGVKKPLFTFRLDGMAFSGSKQVDMTLAEINPPLARDIVNLEHVIAAERAELLANASKTGDLAARQSALQALDTELHDLVSRPLDEIAGEDLDAILKRYAAVVDPATLMALEQLLADVKKSLADLQAELQSLLANFGEQAASVADLVTQSARQGGFDPDDPANYALGDWNIPGVAVPDVSEVPGAFDPGNDPYAAYADAVIAELKAHVSGGEVVERREFAMTVRAWRSNGAAIEKALAMRSGVSQAETSAFLNAENRVVASVPDAEWRAVEPIALESIAAARAGVETYEATVTSRRHLHFIEQHAPYHVRRLPNGGVLLATHPYRTLWPLYQDALLLLGITP